MHVSKIYSAASRVAMATFEYQLRRKLKMQNMSQRRHSARQTQAFHLIKISFIQFFVLYAKTFVAWFSQNTPLTCRRKKVVCEDLQFQINVEIEYTKFFSANKNNKVHIILFKLLTGTKLF